MYVWFVYYQRNRVMSIAVIYIEQVVCIWLTILEKLEIQYLYFFLFLKIKKYYLKFLEFLFFWKKNIFSFFENS